MDTIYTIPLKLIDGTDCNLSKFENNVMLIVNTASKCGYTDQYKGLEELYERHLDKGLVVLGFPCNQFASQEPEDEDAISQFCKINYNIKFPMFSKIEVNGDNTHPLYKELKQRAPGLMDTLTIKWNFTKFLVSRGAKTIRRFAPATVPADIEKEIEALL